MIRLVAIEGMNSNILNDRSMIKTLKKIVMSIVIYCCISNEIIPQDRFETLERLIESHKE